LDELDVVCDVLEASLPPCAILWLLGILGLGWALLSSWVGLVHFSLEFMNTFPKSTVSSLYFTFTKIKPNIENAPPPTAFDGWMVHVREAILTIGSNKSQFNLFFGKLDQLFFDHARWWWREVTPFFAYSTKEGRKCITKQATLKMPIMLKWCNEIPPPPSPSGISSSTKLRQKKRRFSSGRSSIRQSRLTSGTVKSQWRLTKVAHIAAINWWNQWNIGSTAIHSFNMGGNTLPTSLGNSLLKIKKNIKKTLGP